MMCKHDWVGDEHCVYCRNDELVERVRSLEQEVNQAASCTVYYEGSHCQHGVHVAKTCLQCDAGADSTQRRG